MSADLDLVFQHLRDGRFAEAERACRDGLREHGENAGLATMLGVALHRLGRSDEAVQIFRQTVSVHPEAVEALGNLAVLLLLTPGHEAEAERCLHRLRAVQPASLLACQRLGALRQTLGDAEAALRHTRRAARLHPIGSAELFNLAVALTGTGLAREASAVFDTQCLVDPGNATAHAQAAAAHLTLGNLAAATVAFARAIRLDPADVSAINGLARIQRYQMVASVASGAKSAEVAHPSAGAMGLLVRGPYQGVSGYAHMTNRFVDTMRVSGLPVHAMGLFGTEAWADPPESPPFARAIVNCVIPPVVEPLPGLKTVTFSMFEGTRIPLFWKRYSDLHDLVVVPTESSRIAWAERGFPEDRLRVCPLGVDHEMLDGPTLPIQLPDGRPLFSVRHRILNVSDFIPRKNVDGVLRVWLSATSAKDDAVLILKLGKGNPQTRAGIEALVRQTEAVVGKRLAQAAPVVLIDRTLDDGAMTALIRSATHYWSLSHGEGWDLPMSKAGAMGLQLIAPAHSSYMDYLDETVARMIPATIGPAHLPNSREPWPTFYGLDWWEPDDAAAASIIAAIAQGRGGENRDARRHLLDHYTWSQALDRLLAILRDTGAF